MEIKHQFDGGKGVFFIEGNGTHVAEMTYELSGPSTMTIHHTHVSSALKGQGAGKKLVQAGVEHARVERLKIIPWCSFAQAEFEKNADYADVWLKPPKEMGSQIQGAPQ